MTADVVFKLKVIANINHHYREQNYTLSFADWNLSAPSINHNKTQEKNYQEAPGVKPKLQTYLQTAFCEPNPYVKTIYKEITVCYTMRTKIARNLLVSVGMWTETRWRQCQYGWLTYVTGGGNTTVNSYLLVPLRAYAIKIC